MALDRLRAIPLSALVPIGVARQTWLAGPEASGLAVARVVNLYPLTAQAPGEGQTMQGSTKAPLSQLKCHH